MNPVERRLIDALLKGDDPMLESLRGQVAAAALESREMSGVGFFLNFTVPDSVPRVGAGRIIVGDVYFDLEGLEYGGGTILFVDDGHISMLEAYLYADPKWPDKPHLTRVYYDSNPRNLDTLRKNWASQQGAEGDGLNRSP